MLPVMVGVTVYEFGTDFGSPGVVARVGVLVSGWGFDAPAPAGTAYPGLASSPFDLPVPSSLARPDSHWGVALYLFDSDPPRLIWFVRSAQKQSVLTLDSVEDIDEDEFHVHDLLRVTIEETGDTYVIDISRYRPCIRTGEADTSLLEIGTSVDGPTVEARRCEK